MCQHNFVSGHQSQFKRLLTPAPSDTTPLAQAALNTIDVILSYMRSIPNWAYMGGADATDIGNGGKWFTTAGTGQKPMIKMHYRAGLNQIPLAEYYRAHPDDFDLLEIIVGALSGQATCLVMSGVVVRGKTKGRCALFAFIVPLGGWHKKNHNWLSYISSHSLHFDGVSPHYRQLQNIADDGAMSIAFHSHPYVMKNDAYSGDYGLGFFGISLEATAYFLLHKDLGPLCYLCDLSSVDTHDDQTNAGVFAGTISPRDSYRQRVYIEPLGLFIQADTGVFDALEVDLAAKTIRITYAAFETSPAGEQTFSMFRLRVDQVSRQGLRPGQNFTVVEPASASIVRSAFQFPAAPGKVATATIAWK
jgi:hypothetical protein